MLTDRPAQPVSVRRSPIGRSTASLLVLGAALAGAPLPAGAEQRGDGHELTLIAGLNLYECTLVSHAGLGYGYDPSAWLVIEGSVEYMGTDNLCTEWGTLLGSETLVATGAGARLRPFQMWTAGRAAEVGHALTMGLHGHLLWALDSPVPGGEGLSATFIDLAAGYEYRRNPLELRITMGVWVPIHGYREVLPMIQAAGGWAF
jgi:hypothetical protein